MNQILFIPPYAGMCIHSRRKNSNHFFFPILLPDRMDYAWMRWIRNLRPARLPVMRWVKCLSRINGEKNENDRKTFVIDSYTVRMPRVIRSRLYIERLVPFQRKKHSDRSPPRRQATAKSNENSVPLDIDDDHMYTRFILFFKTHIILDDGTWSRV